MSTWDQGEAEIACGTCGAVHIVEWKNFPEKDRGIVKCEVEGCDGIVKAWKGTRDYGPARLKE